MAASDEKRAGKYIEVVFTVPRDIHEGVCDYIIENITTGLVLEDEDETPFLTVRFYVSADHGVIFKDALARHINAAVDREFISAADIKTTVIDDVEWQEEYRLSVKPVYIDNVVIRPPWMVLDRSDLIELIEERRACLPGVL